MIGDDGKKHKYSRLFEKTQRAFLKKKSKIKIKSQISA
jgi:hypothetical protein